jgi:endonuclease YncB( thermonuclease family)
MPRPRRKLPSTRFWFWTGVATLVVLRVLTYSHASNQRDFSVPPLRNGPCRVVRVLSGNQIVIVQDEAQGEAIVRLLSTQTPPEGHPLFDQAKRFTAAFLDGDSVQLKLDNHRLDSEGRYLAYVECDGEQLNEALLSVGLATFYDFPGNSASVDRRLKDAEAFARSEKLGLWRQ